MLSDGTSERSRRVAALAGRLRMAQSDLADEKPEVRREQVESEISRAIASIPPQDREAFLRELLVGFPIGLSASEAAGAAPTGRAGAPKPEPAAAEPPRDPAMIAESMADGLLKVWSTISAEQKQSLLAKLSKGGVAPSASGPGVLSDAATQKLRGALGLGTTDQPDPQKVGDMAVMLLEFVLSLDRVVWGAWSRTIAPASAVRANGPVQRPLRELVVGKKDAAGQPKPGVSAASMTASTPGNITAAGEVQRLSTMTVALVSAVAQAGKSFGQKFMSQFSPGAIEDSINDSGFGNKDAQRWLLYKARAASLDTTSIDAEITQAVVRSVEEWMKRAGR